jgi:hypothetical protein
MNTISLQEISYPVYKLPDKPNVDDGIIYYYSEQEKEDLTISKLLIVDDANIEGDTLAKRRLRILSEGTKVYRLTNAIFFLGDLIKLATPQTNFIDSKGRLFVYRKDKFAKLKFYKIDRVMPITTGGAIISVVGIPSRFKVLNTPNDNIRYAGILQTGMANILYGLYENDTEDTRRKI